MVDVSVKRLTVWLGTVGERCALKVESEARTNQLAGPEVQYSTLVPYPGP